MNDTLKAYIASHLQECCDELVEWEQTGVLRKGHMRHAKRFCSLNITDDVLNLRAVENMVKTLAVYYVKNNHTP